MKCLILIVYLVSTIHGFVVPAGTLIQSDVAHIMLRTTSNSSHIYLDAGGNSGSFVQILSEDTEICLFNQNGLLMDDGYPIFTQELRSSSSLLLQSQFGPLTINASGDVAIQSAGDISLKAPGLTTIETAGDFSLTSSENISISADRITFNLNDMVAGIFSVVEEFSPVPQLYLPQGILKAEILVGDFDETGSIISTGLFMYGDIDLDLFFLRNGYIGEDVTFAHYYPNEGNYATVGVTILSAVWTRTKLQFNSTGSSVYTFPDIGDATSDVIVADAPQLMTQKEIQFKNSGSHPATLDKYQIALSQNMTFCGPWSCRVHAVNATRFGNIVFIYIPQMTDMANSSSCIHINSTDPVAMAPFLPDVEMILPINVKKGGDTLGRIHLRPDGTMQIDSDSAGNEFLSGHYAGVLHTSISFAVWNV